ncbi:MAG TPA: hypothetical protein PKJ65_05160 [Clostridia bacterium]|nr:hypothetical protein [Clostridia bacterium]
MEDTLKILIQMQSLDDKIGQYRQLQDELPKQLNSILEKVELATAKLLETETQRSELSKKLRAVEMDIKTHQEQAKKYATQLTDIKTNKEYKALNSEIAYLHSKISDLESAELELMDEDAVFKQQIDEDKAALAAAEQEKKDKEGEDASEEKPVNNTSPLWLKDAKDCTDEEYKAFYREVFRDFKEPLFWIHLKMDYPVNLRGILYFPKLTNEYNTLEGKIQLYCNQVYVADNIKEVIPEYLLLLKGVIDCPDLPLNVSRSFLQNDGYSGKIAGHISKKVSDKLKQLYKSDAEQYYKYWDDINIFVKYGCLKEEKFYDKVKDIIVYKDIYDKHHTLEQYRKINEEKKHKDVIYYVSDMQKQAQYINIFKEHQQNAVILDNILDSHFLTFIESNNPGTSFMSIDSGIKDVLAEEGATEGFDDIKKFFLELLKDKKVSVEVEALKSSDVSAVIISDEYESRMKNMQTMYGMEFPSSNTLVLNTQHPVISKLAAMKDERKKSDIAIYIYQLAMLSAGKLEKEDMTDFLKRNNEMLNKSTE